MEIIRSTEAMQSWALKNRGQGRRLGFVPTMGYLHEGHMSLVRVARAHADLVAVSIFVNPIQFLPGEDLAAYPRDFGRDEAMCREAGVDVLFHPGPEEMYAPDHSTYVEEMRLSLGLCGGSRPGHFRGVTTVVARLFNIVLPTVAVFGQKDAQQARVIQRMVRDLAFPVHVMVAPIVREPDGLAMSSRNKYLSPLERKRALCLRRALDRAEELYRRGSRDAAHMVAEMSALIAAVPGTVVDYIAVVDNVSLEAVATISGPVLVLLAVRVGATRLIDNTVLGA